MGCESSCMYSEKELKKINNDFDTSFNDFIACNCIRGDDQYTLLITLQAAYIHFIKDNYPSNYNKMYRIIDRSNVLIKLCNNRNFTLSSGYILDYLDTRHVIGISVARFNGSLELSGAPPGKFAHDFRE